MGDDNRGNDPSKCSHEPSCYKNRFLLKTQAENVPPE